MQKIKVNNFTVVAKLANAKIFLYFSFFTPSPYQCLSCISCYLKNFSNFLRGSHLFGYSIFIFKENTS